MPPVMPTPEHPIPFATAMLEAARLGDLTAAGAREYLDGEALEEALSIIAARTVARGNCHGCGMSLAPATEAILTREGVAVHVYCARRHWPACLSLLERDLLLAVDGRIVGVAP